MIEKDLEKYHKEFLKKEVDIYCLAAKESLMANRVIKKEYFKEYVSEWKDLFSGFDNDDICNLIVSTAKNSVKKEGWEEYDVDGLTWFIGVKTLIAKEANLISDFDSAFKEAYIKYLS